MQIICEFVRKEAHGDDNDPDTDSLELLLHRGKGCIQDTRVFKSSAASVCWNLKEQLTRAQITVITTNQKVLDVSLQKTAFS